MQVIIDRFEGDFAVVEYINDDGHEEFANVPKVLLIDADEGDVVDITVNKDETKRRADNIKSLMDSLFE